MTLVAAKRPQLKKRAKRDWSVAKAAKFLGVLAETCNVSEACRRSRVPMTVVYRRRKMDATFRAAWVEAIGLAYHRLELALLERAFNGTEKVIRRKDGSEERVMQLKVQASANERARWLAELAEALEQAQKLAWRMGLLEGDSVEAMELYGRLEAARMEVQSLRFGRFGTVPREYDPKWMDLVPWDSGPPRA